MSDGRALRAGVIGWPVRHSLSPLIHGRWLQALGIDGEYGLHEAAPEHFAETVGRLRAAGLRGLNVTVPHKEAAFRLADTADAAATGAGAANLLLFREDGAVEGRNTDGLGLLAALAEQAPGWKAPGAVVAVIGAGGAAFGAVAALHAAGAAALRIVNRSPGRAQALADRFGGAAYPWEGAAEAMRGADLVVNATTRGLNGAEPLALPWPEPPAGDAGAALDMVYRPLRTAFLGDARGAGWRPVDGLAMLIGQARPSFEALYGRPAPPAADVRGACLAALGEDPDGGAA